MNDHLRLLVAVPSGTLWQAQFGVCLINLVAGFTKVKIPGFKSQSLQVANVRSSILSKNRLDAVKAAKAAHAHYILFLDTDHTFPVSLVHQLIQHRRLVVAANCVTKQIPAQPTARARVPHPQGVPVYSDPDSYGLEEVWRVGTGVMLINMKVFEQIGMGVWDMKYLPEEETYQGEDWTFCEACENAGIPLYIDHDLSKQIGHLGNYEFTHDVVGELAKTPIS
jgi:hypothetical protein